MISIAVGIRKDGSIHRIGGGTDSLDKQIELERAAMSSGEYAHIIRVNDDGSMAELKVHMEFRYEPVTTGVYDD